MCAELAEAEIHDWTIDLVGQDHQGARALCQIVPLSIDWDDPEYFARLRLNIVVAVREFSATIEGTCEISDLTTFMYGMRDLVETPGLRIRFTLQRTATIDLYHVGLKGALAVRVAICCPQLDMRVRDVLADWPHEGTPIRFEAAYVSDDSYLQQALHQAELFVSAMSNAQDRRLGG